MLILSCPDQRGIVATVTALLFEHGANIEESQQFYDERTDRFFMRIRFSVEAGGPSTRRLARAVRAGGDDLRHGVVGP